METEKEKYWDNRYHDSNTPWDIGYANPGIIKYVRSQYPTSTHILLPGAGIGHEAAVLYELGYTNTYVNEWSEAAKQRMLSRYPNFPAKQILICDFFELDGRYDLILEQTFFCALPPYRRSDYVDKIKTLLKPNGVFAGAFFDRLFPDEGPPYGGDAESYRQIFSREFDVTLTTPWEDSIPPRAGTECWLEARLAQH